MESKAIYNHTDFRMEKEHISHSHPSKGRVLATLEPDERKRLASLCAELDAIEKADNVKFSHALDIIHLHRDAWGELMQKYNLDPAWRMTFCEWTGRIISTGF